MSRNEAFEGGKAERAKAAAISEIEGVRNPYNQPRDIMLGGKNSPGGATSASITAFPSITEVRLYKGKKNIGMVETLGGEIDHIETAKDFTRKGVATEAFRLANFAHGRVGGSKPLEHGSVRTPSGDAWAKATGDKLPERTPSFGTSRSRLEDRK